MTQEQDHFVITRGSRTGEKIPLDNLPVVMGRMLPADVIIDIENVSRKHARISRDATGYVIEDLGSSNGTYVNNERIQGARTLLNGDIVRLGLEIELQLVIAVPQQPKVTILKMPADPAPNNLSMEQ